MDEATVAILMKIKQEGLETFSDIASRLGDMRTRALEAAAAFKILGEAQEDVRNRTTSGIPVLSGLLGLLQAIPGEVVKMTQGLLGLIPVVGTQLSGAFQGWMSSLMQIPVMGSVITGVITGVALAVLYLSAAFVTAAATVGAAVVTILATVVAGFTAIGLAAALTLGPIGLMSAAVLMLADRMFTTGQTAVDPLLKLEKAAGAMADTWGRIATPIALQLTDAMIKMLPAITSAGQQMLLWFGEQLPRILPLVSDLTRRMSDAFNQAWPATVQFFSELMNRAPALGPMFSQVMSSVVDALKGASENFLKFLDWFRKEWPTLAPIVQQVMEQAGKFVQWFAAEAKKLVDWFVANWPQIAELARNLQPVLVQLVNAFETLVTVFGKIALSYNDAVRGLNVVRGAVQDLAGAFRGLGSAAGGWLNTLPAIGAGAIGGLLPGFQGGGTVPGPVGAPQIAIVHGGERIIPVGGSMGTTEELLAQAVMLLSQIAAQGRGGMSTRAYASRAV